MKRLYPVFLVLVFLSSSFGATDSIASWAIDFRVWLPGGWSCWTAYCSDGSVEGGHQSGGQLPFLHLTEAKAPHYFLDTLYSLAKDAMNSCPPYDRSVKKWPSYHINIYLFNNEKKTVKIYKYSIVQCHNFKELPLKKLAAIINKNQIIYCHNKPTWNTSYEISNDTSHIADCEKEYEKTYNKPPVIKTAADSQAELEQKMELEMLKKQLEEEMKREQEKQ